MNKLNLKKKIKFFFKKDLKQLCSYLLLYTVRTVSTIYGNGSPQSFPFTSICEQNKLHVLTDGQATFISGTNLFSFAPSIQSPTYVTFMYKTLSHPFARTYKDWFCLEFQVLSLTYSNHSMVFQTAVLELALIMW